MIRKTSISVVRVFVVLFLHFTVYTQVFAQITNEPESNNKDLPEWGYAHIGLAGNMFEVNPGSMNDLIEPFEVSTPINFDYFLYLCGGFRNIAQIEYRWGNESNNLFYDEVGFPPTQINRTTVDMKFEYSQVLFKANPLFFLKDLESWTFFFVWGSGSVDYIDNKGDGFNEGTKKITGGEIGKVLKYFALSTSYEYNSMEFKKFKIQGYEPINRNFDASTWQVNLKVSVGFGI